MTNNHTFILSGRYQIIRSLGTGQTSTVYLARHLSLDAERAIKVIPKTGASPVSVLTEAQLLKSLNHPGIPMIVDIEEDDITMDSKIADDLGADSLDVVDLIMAIEDEFEVEIPDEDIENIKTVGDVVNYINDNR